MGAVPKKTCKTVIFASLYKLILKGDYCLVICNNRPDVFLEKIKNKFVIEMFVCGDSLFLSLTEIAAERGKQPCERENC